MARKIIKLLLKKKSITTYKMCKDLELNRSTVYNWLNGTTNQIGIETATKILTYLKTP